MEKSELLSISIPTRNRCFYLQELLESIRKQTVYQPLLLERIQIYIFDNDSNDGTAEMIAACDLPILYKNNGVNIGAADNIFQAYAVPTGQYIWVIGDDELLPDHAIETILNLLEEHQPSLLLTKAAGYESFVQMPAYFNNYKEFALFAQQHNPHLLLAHTLISANIVRKECFDTVCARQYKRESYAQMMGIIRGVNQYPGKVLETQEQTLIIREERANFDDISAEDIQKIKAKSQLILRDQITYLAWLKQEYDLKEIVPQRVVGDYNLRLSPFLPKVSILIHFTMDESLEIDDNLKKLTGSIESVLVQDYCNIEIFVVSQCYFWKEYVQSVEKNKPYGKAVHYIEVMEETETQELMQHLAGEYMMLMNAGECLSNVAYLTSAVGILLNHADIGLVFGNYALQEPLSRVAQQSRELNFPSHLAQDSWTKWNGQWLLSQYDKIWSMPCTSVFRRLSFVSKVKEVRNFNKLLFLPMLLNTHVVFHNSVVAVCPSERDNSQKGHSIQDISYIDTAALEAMQRGYVSHEVQAWRSHMVKHYFGQEIQKADGKAALLLDLYEIGKQTGTDELLHEAMVEALLHFKQLTRPRFLLIKAWGCGIWADVDHVLGQLLLAEILHRVPVVYWGKESLYYSGDKKNTFEKCFLPVSQYCVDEVITKDTSYYPAKWNYETIYERDVDKYTKPYSEKEIPSLFALTQQVLVSEVHVGIEVILNYLPLGHDLYGCDREEAARRLYKKYIKLQPELQQNVDDFYEEHMCGKKVIAAHVRAGDRTESQEKLYSNNQLYYSKIAEFSRNELDYRVLLLTDSEYVLQEFKNRYGEKLIYTECHRTGNNQGIHYSNHIVDKSLLAKETAIEVYLAAQCDYFIGCRSNVSATVLRLKDWDIVKTHLFMQLPSAVL